MRIKKLLICVIILSIVFSIFPYSKAECAGIIVRAVLFYSPNCGHCHFVITEVLPPLYTKYGEQLQVVAVDVSQPDGQQLFMIVLDYFKVDYAGVPFLAVGDTYLIGSVDIPEKFPALIEDYLRQGGVDWPEVPGLVEAMMTTYSTNQSPTIVATPTSIEPGFTGLPKPDAMQSNDLREKFYRDPLGNSLSVIVLVGMLIVLGVSIFHFQRALQGRFQENGCTVKMNWLIPILCLIGLGVAGYLAFIEMTRVEAVCGPVGDCNSVQQSEYAILFGAIPIGLLGMVGYMMILAAWVVTGIASQRLAAYVSLAQFGMTAIGVLFSIYLTFLEPFVIGATCAWCLTSAILMTALLWLSLKPACKAINQFKHL